MNEDTIMNNVKAIKEMVLDEQRLVTYISLSKELCIHVNEAKMLLVRLVEDIKCNNPNVKLFVNYIISGSLKNNSARTIVCSYEDLEVRKNEFNIIFFQHIYSVSQGPVSQDSASLVAVHNFDDLRLCTGLIKGSSCLKHTSNEISTFKSNNQVSTIEQCEVKKEIKNKTKDRVKRSEVDEISKGRAVKSEPVMKSEVISPKKEEQTSASKSQNKKNSLKTSKSIAGFFTKTSGATKSIKNESNTQVNKVKDINTFVKSEKMDVDEDVTISNGKKTNPKVETKNKALNSIKKNARVDNKRKRVLHVSDSESDNEKEKDDPFADEPLQTDHESEDEIPPTPQPNTVRITSGIINPKKRRKLVDKTYTDEEGYILTKKEEVYESCSDTEDVSSKENIEQVKEVPKIALTDNKEVSPKDKKNKTSKKKGSPPQKGNQATLMSFFKKVSNKG